MQDEATVTAKTITLDAATGKATNEHEVREALAAAAAERLASQNQLPVYKLSELPEVLVGLSEAEVGRLLAKFEGAHIVVLCGMGGVGKTTLAKALLNKLNRDDPTALCQLVQLSSADACLKSVQEALLRSMAFVQGAALKDAQHGRQVLLETLRGKRVLLVLDNVRLLQLQRLLPTAFADCLAPGSKIIVTSCERGIAGALSGGASKVAEVEVGCLSRHLSAELFCRYAYGQPTAPDGKEEVVGEVVTRCDGLPMALEIAGRYFGKLPDGDVLSSEVPGLLLDAFNIQLSGRLEPWRTMFEEVNASWVELSNKEKEALLDIAWFLGRTGWGAGGTAEPMSTSPGGRSAMATEVAGQCWEHVSWFLGEEDGRPVLEELCNKYMVQRIGSGERTDVAGVHGVIQDFCKLGLKQTGMQRLTVDGSEAADSSLAELLQQVPEAEALLLRGWQLKSGDFQLLSQLPKLRLLWVEGLSIMEESPSINFECRGLG